MIFVDHLSEPYTVTGVTPSRCTRRASSILPHSADARPVVACDSQSGARVYLCAGCLAAMEAERYAQRMGLVLGGEQQLRALVVLRDASAGYEPPSSGARVNQLWRALKLLTAKQFAMRVERRDDAGRLISVLFALRDACPDPECLRRDGTHSAECGLVFGEAFAERTKERVG